MLRFGSACSVSEQTSLRVCLKISQMFCTFARRSGWFSFIFIHNLKGLTLYPKMNASFLSSGHDFDWGLLKQRLLGSRWNRSSVAPPSCLQAHHMLYNSQDNRQLPCWTRIERLFKLLFLTRMRLSALWCPSPVVPKDFIFIFFYLPDFWFFSSLTASLVFLLSGNSL